MIATNTPPGHDLPPLRLIGFIVELILCCILNVLTVIVGYKLWNRHNYHINLRISVFNMYCSIPILTFSRSLWIIHIFSEEKFLPPIWVNESLRLLTLAMSAFWVMQLPAIIERICATAFYRTYLNWKCYETLFIIFICWVLVINICYDVIPMPISFAYVVIGIANVIIVPLYIILFWINFNRYKNKSQSLTERYQVFQNVESLYPLAWTVAVEVVHNIYTVAAVLVVNIVVKPSNNASYYVCMDSVSYLTREIILLAYCIPFLVYSKERRKAQFINKVNAENQNVNMLYFKQLKEQW